MSEGKNKMKVQQYLHQQLTELGTVTLFEAFIILAVHNFICWVRLHNVPTLSRAGRFWCNGRTIFVVLL